MIIGTESGIGGSSSKSGLFCCVHFCPLEKQESILFSELPAIDQILEWAWMITHLEGQIWIQNYKDNGKLCHSFHGNSAIKIFF